MGDTLGAPPGAPLGATGYYCVLLTGTVCPIPDITHQTRSSPALRLAEYRRSLAAWSAWAAVGLDDDDDASSPAPGARARVFFAENSGLGLGELRSLAPGVTLLSSHDREPLGGRGKGYAEHRALRWAVAQPEMAGCGVVVKVTGRYFVPGLAGELERLAELPDRPDVVVQSTPSDWNMWEETGGVVRSEVVGFRPDLVDFLFGGQDEQVGEPMERVLQLRVMQVEREGGRVERFGGMPVDGTRNAEGKVVTML
ncbi:hypothetical protein TeGR_g6009 [Tetraparma gracilis]|uniref:Uncharacterized protein n=1 Tax=Tetraparma gracilis TaxID=2962635 RepID=A0ABQ6M3S0_9STRA|nr:hypothetical protein TeGR_g6009 [Tetraparma gracilis]